MGENILILAFVVIVIGGIGSIRGALRRRAGGRASSTRSAARCCRCRCARCCRRQMAANLGPSLASILIYVLMAAVLFWRPQGLFPAPRRVMASDPRASAAREDRAAGTGWR